MQKVYTVQAFWDDEAKVWVASGLNFGGLATEAETVEKLLQKLPNMIVDLIEANEERVSGEVPLQLLVQSKGGQFYHA